MEVLQYENLLSAITTREVLVYDNLSSVPTAELKHSHHVHQKPTYLGPIRNTVPRFHMEIVAAVDTFKCSTYAI